MQTEIEAKFLNVDHDAIRAKLKQAGAVCEQPMRLMRRAIFDYPDGRFQKDNHNQRLRVRDEGDKITVTYKQKNDSPYPYEIETVVGSYDEMVKIFEAVGLVIVSIQESKRETWHYKNVEVVLDKWPWLEAYIEIEGPDESGIRAVAEDLGFDWKNAEFGSVDTAYRHQYPGMERTESIGDIAKVVFNLPLPEYLKKRKIK